MVVQLLDPGCVGHVSRRVARGQVLRRERRSVQDGVIADSVGVQVQAGAGEAIEHRACVAHLHLIQRRLQRDSSHSSSGHMGRRRLQTVGGFTPADNARATGLWSVTSQRAQGEHAFPHCQHVRHLERCCNGNGVGRCLARDAHNG